MGDSFLQVEIRHPVGALALDVSFTVTAPWTILFGASGSGKTSVLRTIAGFVRPNEGHIVVSNEALVDTKQRIFVPPHRRKIRIAGQAARLFKGMSVRDNLTYGASTQALDALITLFRLERLLTKQPEALSGGEQQRVSIARAVASAVSGKANLLLLDEPFGGLDFALRDAIAVKLREFTAAQRLAVLSVTHDVGEAFLLEAEVIRIAEGRVAAQGAVAEVLANERASLLAQLGASPKTHPRDHESSHG